MTRIARLLLISCLALSLAGSRVAPAHAATTLKVTECSSETGSNGAVGIGDAVATANKDSGDTIAFGCSGTIPLTSTLAISSNITIDSSGQSVVLDGGHTSSAPRSGVPIFYVNPGVTFGLSRLTLQKGFSPAGGGATYNNGGAVTITNSTLSGNSASGGFGGAIFNYHGTVSITNSTLSGNSASFGGGAIDNVGTVTVTNSTFSGNSARGVSGAIENYQGTVKVGGTIIAKSPSGGNCLNYGGTFTDLGYNLEDDSGASCGFSSGKPYYDLVGSDPAFVLDSKGNPLLTDNGGPTQTIALQASSPAIDQIPTSYDIPNNNPTTPLCSVTDQRGQTRPDHGESACDLGAYEHSSAPTTTIRLTPTQPTGQKGWYSGPVTVSLSASDSDDAASSLVTRCALDPPVVPTSFSALPSGSCPYAASGGASVSSDGVHHLYAASEGPHGDVEAVQSTTFQIDQTPPTITASLTPARPASTGWYNRATGAPTVRYSCSDAISGIAGSCPAAFAFPQGANQSHSVTVSDQAGNSTTATVSGINVDLTPPTVSYHGNADSYTVDQTISITCSASDALSGVASTTCQTISGPAYSFGLGSHTYSASATDKAGNGGSGSTSFVVKDTVAGLSTLTKQYVTNQQIASSLVVLLEGGKYAGYIALVQAYSHDSQLITPAHAALLIQLAQAL